MTVNVYIGPEPTLAVAVIIAHVVAQVVVQTATTNCVSINRISNMDNNSNDN